MISLFSFLEPSFADTAEGFKESGVCDGLLSGQCVDVVVGCFLTVGGVLARELSLICNFKCEFNDNSESCRGKCDWSCEEIGLIFYPKYLLLQFLHRQETLLRQVSCLDDNVGIVE